MIDVIDAGAVTLAQAAPPGGLLANPLVMVVAMIAVFYLLVWRPQQKQVNEARRFRDSLKSDDRVITAGGIYGRIVEVDAASVLLEVSPKMKMRVLRSQIAKHQTDATEDDADGQDTKK